MDNRPVQIRPARHDELDTLAALAARCQAEPGRRIPYLDLDAAVLADEVGDTEPGSWWERTVVAVVDQRVAGWLMADTDIDMGRTWWNGPFVVPGLDDVEAAAIADSLYAAFPTPPAEQELCFDPSSTLLASFAERHGFTAEEGSAALAVEIPAAAAARHPAVRQPSSDAEREAIAALHDALFPGTHTTGRVLAAGDDGDRLTLGMFTAEDVVGYVSVEFQPGNSLYVDYLGVEPALRGRGYGRALVADALQRAAEAGSQRAHLTVRMSNVGARRIYERLGFVEEQLIVPARKGFSLA